MSEEIQQKTIISMLIIAMVLSLGGTIVVLTKLSDLNFKQQLTGYASNNDTGTARIQISTEVGIEVDPSYNTIDFGTCSRPISGTVYINSTMNEAEINATAINCTTVSTFPTYLMVKNVGNVNANVTIRTDTTGATLLNDAGNSIDYSAVNDTGQPGCSGTLQESWTTLSATGDQGYNVCDSLIYGGTSPAVNVNIMLGINNLADTGTGANTATLTFVAEEV